MRGCIDCSESQAKCENLAGAGTSVGVQVWRIEQFKVVNVDKTDYGHFFNGCKTQSSCSFDCRFAHSDAYIVLHTFKKKGPDGEPISKGSASAELLLAGKETDALAHAEHFWLGKNAPQDARGTAACPCLH